MYSLPASGSPPCNLLGSPGVEKNARKRVKKESFLGSYSENPVIPHPTSKEPDVGWFLLLFAAIFLDLR